MKSARRMGWALLIAASCVWMVSRPVLADDDPPARVARLNLVQGSVSFQPAGGGDNDWTNAAVNRPMSTGDRVWADQDGRAELHVGSTAVRIDHNTGISFLTLTDRLVQLQLSAGSVIIRLRKLDSTDAVEVDAPNLAFSLLRPGDYRLDADPDKNVTTVSVIQGEGEVTGGGRSWQIIADQRATFTGTDDLQYDLADVHAVQPSEFDTWSGMRDQQEDRALATSARYVPPDLTGTEDLGAYGAWRTDPVYGAVWVPAGVAVGWAPYRFGHWVWMAPWGWTWVEDEPWGFAPFHYGRWVFVGGAWGWVPGPVAARPVYAPALVAWVGGAPGFSFSVSFGVGGGIGWFPLGPHEVFVPAYRVSDEYVTRVNVTNTVVERTTVINVYHNNVTNITYANQHVNGGVTVVSHDTFVNARPVGRNVVAVPDRELAAAPVSRTFETAPVHSSLVGEGRPATARPPAAILNRTVVTARTPAAAPARFGEQPGARGSAVGSQGTNPPAARAMQPAPSSQPNYRPAPRTLEEQGAPQGARNVPTGGGQGGNQASASSAQNPNARPAPPVRQPTPAEQQTDAAKQGQWQQQHQQVHQKDAAGKPAGKSAERDEEKKR